MHLAQSDHFEQYRRDERGKEGLLPTGCLYDLINRQMVYGEAVGRDRVVVNPIKGHPGQ